MCNIYYNKASLCRSRCFVVEYLPIITTGDGFKTLHYFPEVCKKARYETTFIAVCIFILIIVQLLFLLFGDILAAPVNNNK